MSKRFVMAVAAAALLLPSVVLAAPQATLAQARIGGASIEFAPQVDFAKAVLTVSTPGGRVLRFEGNGSVPSFGLFDAKGQPHPDGAYQWELRLAPRMTAELRKQLRAARARGDEGNAGEMVQSGSFVIAGGAFVSSDEREAPVRASVDKALTPTTAADQVIPDDLIVQQSLCVGFDCVNNESFGFDTIRLKENNTRIKFEDTSVGTFPTFDWQLTANDSASGGANKFSIEDITSSKVPFTITGGAATNSIFVDSTGRLGLRSSTPVLDLHINTSNTPAIRLEQNNSGGFTAQTWDIAGNEANFFVRDVTGGSRLSFRIRPGAPTSSLDISSDGDVGVGTASPNKRLHVKAGADDDGIVIERSASGQDTDMQFLNEIEGVRWTMRVDGAAPEDMFIFPTGNTQDLILQSNDTGTALGNVGVGTTSPTSRLHVAGDVRVTGGSFIDDGTTLNVPDYVFESSYDLMPLDELARFVRENKHLPKVPNAEEVKANGVNLSQLGMRLLEKVEELTLYTLAQEQQLGTLRSHNAELQDRLAALERALQEQRASEQ